MREGNAVSEARSTGDATEGTLRGPSRRSFLFLNRHPVGARRAPLLPELTTYRSALRTLVQSLPTAAITNTRTPFPPS